MSFMIVFAMPWIAMASQFLAMDRLVGTHFFNPAEGGDALLWQHLFWFFGHPEVYIIFVPGARLRLGDRRDLHPAAGLRLPGHGASRWSSTAFLGFGLWVHHMFATGMPQLGQSFFTAREHDDRDPDRGADLLLDRHDLGGPPAVHRTRCCSCSASSSLFVIGGLTGVMIASVPFDQQVHDTYFIVAHLHYVLIGGAVFPLFGAFYHWFPKITGRMLSERARALELLAVLPRRQRHLLPDAPAGVGWHAAAGLHLPDGDGLGESEPARQRRARC